ncbi:MAG TPA: IS200/IS605 family transposase [Thermoanaerobaculia bacterium]|nr:IS200/IS605 family transposase [Thermoanaerobaculia bacterium]
MANTFTNLLIHIVFSTKNRIPFLHDSARERTYEYMGGIIREKGGILLEIGGMPDHSHLLVRIKAACSVADMVGPIKSSSSKWVHDTFPTLDQFAWQVGYAAFSVSESRVAAVRRYIRNQAEHHARVSFEDELIALLRKHGIEYDERHLFD